jgi:hypothetical protein
VGSGYESPNTDYGWFGVAEVQPVEALAVAAVGEIEPGGSKQAPTVKLLVSLTRHRTCARHDRMGDHRERDRLV